MPDSNRQFDKMKLGKLVEMKSLFSLTIIPVPSFDINKYLAEKNERDVLTINEFKLFVKYD